MKKKKMYNRGKDFYEHQSGRVRSSLAQNRDRCSLQLLIEIERRACSGRGSIPDSLKSIANRRRGRTSAVRLGNFFYRPIMSRFTRSNWTVRGLWCADLRIVMKAMLPFEPAVRVIYV